METSTVSRRTALIAVSLTSFLTPFMASGVSLGLPGIGESFAMSAVLLGWVATSYTLAAAVFLVPLGKAADIHGRKRVYVLGTALYTLASALCALARSGAGLIVARALQGVGSAMIFGTGIAILTSVFPPEQRGYVMGINTAVTYGGLSAGPFLGGLLVGAWGWRSVFWSNVPLGVIAALFMARKVQGEWADAPSDSFDLLGSVAYGIAVVGGMYGLSRLPDLSGAALIAAAAAVGALFVWHERR
ncbi:MAG: MFS transporter, partial [Chloroflexi bacterium]|nr:MFS transporter [Chloroflexota bacterium]